MYPILNKGLKALNILKIMLLPKHPTRDSVFDNKFMKLFNARPIAIRTFGLRIKQFLTASNIYFSEILETPSYFVLPLCYIKALKIVLDLIHLKKIAQMHMCISSYSWKYETDNVSTFLFIQMVHGIGIMRLVLQSFHQTP